MIPNQNIIAQTGKRFLVAETVFKYLLHCLIYNCKGKKATCYFLSKIKQLLHIRIKRRIKFIKENLFWRSFELIDRFWNSTSFLQNYRFFNYSDNYLPFSSFFIYFILSWVIPSILHQLMLLFSQEKVLLCMQRELLALRLEFTNSRRRVGSMQMVTASSEDIYQLARAEDLCNKMEILG